MFRPLSALLIALATAGALAQPQDQNDAIIWRGDFATGDLSQWHNLLHPQGLSVQSDCVYRGEWAGRATITGDDEFLWNQRSDLNRTEFKYQPPAEHTAAGTDLYFGWSFFLPDALTESRHETGYWESDQSWQQILRFNMVGTAFSFQASRADQPVWEKSDFASPGVWRDVAMHIHWSTDPERGFAEVWLDGESQGRHRMQTLANDADPMFVQLGLLRNQQAAVETIFIDNVRHGSSMAAVLAEFDPDRPVTCL